MARKRAFPVGGGVSTNRLATGHCQPTLTRVSAVLNVRRVGDLSGVRPKGGNGCFGDAILPNKRSLRSFLIVAEMFGSKRATLYSVFSSLSCVTDNSIYPAMYVISNIAPEPELIHLGTEVAKVDDMPSMEARNSLQVSTVNNLFNRGSYTRQSVGFLFS